MGLRAAADPANSMKSPLRFQPGHGHREYLHLVASAIIALGSSSVNASSPYESAVLADRPIAYYRFEETTGTVAADSSGHGRDGSFRSPASLALGVPSATENLGATLQLLGGYVEIPDLGAHRQTSVEGWLQFNSNTHDCCSAIMAAHGWTTGLLHLNLARAGNVLEHAVNGDATPVIRNTEPLSPGTWYHFVVTNDPDARETRFYLNGELITDDGDHSTQTIKLGAAGAQIGAWGGTRQFDGFLDEIAIYDTVLSPERVQAHYAAANDPGLPRITSFTLGQGSAVSDIGLALPTGGGQVTLSWDVAGASTVSINQGVLSPTGTASGSATAAVSSDTRFTLTATNSRGSSTAVVDAFIAPVPAPPRLSEIMALNEGALVDGDGASPDWIEIHNPNRYPIDLAGYQLRDGGNIWTFPSSSMIPALGYRIVFASGTSKTDAAGHLHASFALNNNGEYLGLHRPNGEAVDAFAPAFPPQYGNISFGRHGTQTSSDGYFLVPTPGAANGPGYDALLDKTDDTYFAVGRGFYTAPFDETISAKTPGASIIYTLDGSTPSLDNGVRVAPANSQSTPSAVVRISGNTNTGVTTLRAMAYKDGSAPTNVDTQTYLFSRDVVRQSPSSTIASGWPASAVNGQVFDYGLSLDGIAPNAGSYSPAEVAASLEAIPTLSVVTDQENLTGAGTGIYVNALAQGRAWERPASVELIFPPDFDDPDGHRTGFQIDAGLRIRGGWSRRPEFFKHAFRLFFRGEYGDTKLRFPLFGNEGVSDFDRVDLRSDSNLDWSRETDFNLGRQFTFVRDVFCRDTQGAMGQPYTRSRYYHLYLNGSYWGIYQSQERPESSFGASYFGGDPGDYDVVKCGNHVGGFVTEATEGTLDAFKALWDLGREIGLRDPSDANFFALEGRGPDGQRDPALPVLLDVDNLIDYMLVIFWSGNGDGTLSSFLANNRPNNWFSQRSRTGEHGFRFFVHDNEFTLGSSYSEEDRTGPYVGSNQGNFLYANPQWIHQDLMASAAYRKRFADRVEKHFFRGGALTDPACLARFTRRANEVRDAVKAYAARWADAAYAPGYHVGLWEAEIERIASDWIPGRSATVLAQLKADGLYPDRSGPSILDAAGNPIPDGSVTAGAQLRLADPAGPGGTIYFTLDGSDPSTTGAPTLTATLIDFDSPRSYRVPASAQEGFSASANLSATPLAHYSFDQGATDGATTNGAQNGTLINGASITTDARVGAGALLLDGVDDYVALGDPAELQITGQISLAAWVRATAEPSQTFGNIVAKGHWFDPNSEIFFRYGAHIDSWIIASWDGEVHGADVPGAAADIGQWIHLVGTYDGSHWNLYRNGVLAASRPASVGAMAVPNDWAIGARGTGTERYFPGYIDEVYFFDTALTAEDVASLHAGQSPLWMQTVYQPAASWPTGTGGIGYEAAGGPLAPWIGTNVGPSMQGKTASLYTRAPFTLTTAQLAEIDYLEMNVAYDGGFVAYLNGTEVSRANAPAQLDGASAATASRQPAETPRRIDLSRHASLLRQGSNVLAVHSLNDGAGSPNHLVRYQLRAGRTPRGPSATATVYASPLTITSPVTLNARILRNGEWSPLTTGLFNTASVPASSQNLVISQIHYNPTAPTGSSRPASDYEFLEVMNIGTSTIALGGLLLREDISFDFPDHTFLAPGERAQIVASAAAFAERYGSQPTRVLGVFAGNLANEGGRLHLSSSQSGTIRDFSFRDGSPWPNLADGEGFGLVLIRPESNPNHADPLQWRSSAENGARPGQSDAQTFAGNPSADVDGDGWSAFAEYALGTSDTVTTRDPWIVNSGGFSISRRTNADDAQWIVETSEDLIHWLTDPVYYSRTTIPGPSPSLVQETYRLDPQLPPRTRFLRVRILQR
jgi:hypothetical protein